MRPRPFPWRTITEPYRLSIWTSPLKYILVDGPIELARRMTVEVRPDDTAVPLGNIGKPSISQRQRMPCPGVSLRSDRQRQQRLPPGDIANN